MTITMTNSLSDRPLRSLNDTIGRLDTMIDGLSEAIPQTIRDTLQESVSAAVTEGVRVALLEVLRNPDILTLLRDSLAPMPDAVPVAPRPGTLQSLVAKTRSAVAAIAQRCRAAVHAGLEAVSASVCRVANQVTNLRRRLAFLRWAYRPLLVALLVGGLAAAGAAVAPQWVAATLSGLAGTCVTLAVQAGLWVRRTFTYLALNSD